MSDVGPLPNRVRWFRQERRWSQEELARLAGISRAAVSAIEIQRLVPSVAAALALAHAFQCTVEDLFRVEGGASVEERWAWPPGGDPCSFWRASVGGRVLRFPAETTVAGMLAHDGVLSRGETQILRDVDPAKTLVLASCDPAAGMLAAEYERATGFRLLPLHRSSRIALEMLHQGLVHVAGIHLATSEEERGNARAAKALLGDGFSLLRCATWQEGLAVRATEADASVRAVLRSKRRWIGREAGTGARQCQDAILQDRRAPRRLARDHYGIADAIRCGWADVGICLRLVSDQAGLRFIPVRNEAYDLCFSAALEADVRVKKLIDLLRSPAIQTLFESLPGYELSRSIDFQRI